VTDETKEMEKEMQDKKSSGLKALLPEDYDKRANPPRVKEGA